MKKIISLVLVSVLAFGLVACTSKPTSETTGSEIALITDVGTIDDKSFNQGSWEGVVQYAEEKGISHKFYQPAEKSDEAVSNAIDLAVKGGAKVIVCPGFLFNVPLYTAQEKYPDVNFIIIDGEPTSTEGESKIGTNVSSIYFAEEQAGYLAGYAAVIEGNTKLGFMGGIALPAVNRFGYGFIQGADDAAAELGLKQGDVTVKYTNLGNFEPTPENNAKASAWYQEGTDVIFVAAGGAGNSVMKAAETTGKKVIGVDVDQATESDTVITSAMKNLQKAVYDSLTDYYDGNFKGGVSVLFTAVEDGVALPMDTSRFEKFTKEQYDETYEKIASGKIEVLNDATISAPTEIPTEVVTVNFN